MHQYAPSTALIVWRLFCLFGALAAGPLPALAQQAGDLQAQSEQALADARPVQAAALAQQILAQNAADFAALFVLSLAQAELGNDDAAASTAARAYDAGRTDAERLQAARLAAAARFRQGQYLRAQWWLRRAANHADTPQDAQTIRQEFQQIKQANPLDARLGFSVAPSDNINNGAAQDFFTLEGLDIEFALPPSSLPLAGVEFAGDIQLSYRLSQSDRHSTLIEAYLYGRTFVLTPDAQATVPDLSGRDYALSLAEVSLSHGRLVFPGLGPTTVSGHVGRVWFSGDPLWDYQKLALAQVFPVGQSDILTLRASVQDQQAQSDLQPDTVIYEVSGTYAAPLPNGDVMELTLTGLLNEADAATDTFTEARALLDYRIDAPLLGTRWAVSLGVGQVNYDEFTLSLDGRRDTFISLGGTVLFEEVSYFGFSPTLSVTGRRTVSNVSQFTNNQIEARIGIQSTF